MINKIVNKKTIIIFILFLFVGIILYQNIENKQVSNSATFNAKYVKEIKLTTNSRNLETMKKNTTILQNAINEVSKNGGGVVKIPKGTFYFYPTDSKKLYQYYIIKCKNNVTIEGSGNSTNGTILKPVGNLDLPVDMFYFNELQDTKKAVYLDNADFKNFIIDGIEVKVNNNKYNTAGKGFMINLYKNCDWENITVKNTYATGFGMDNPINSTIINSTAIGCGRGGTSESAGASGFGIGTGYSNNESITISNCTAIGNRKYGFFFEHQGRFSPNYTATSAKSLIVINSKSYGNLYNFGGERANDVTFKNSYSYQNGSTNPLNIVNKSAIHFGTNSRRTTLQNMIVDKDFTDVSKNSPYYNAVKWGLNTSIIEGGTDTSKYEINNITTRAQAILMIWRLEGRPGKVVSYKEQLFTGFSDVPSGTWYEDALVWGVDNGIISPDKNFNPNNGIKRAEFITMLWRNAGKPIVNNSNQFSDIPENQYYTEAVKWAANKKIIENYNASFFEPSAIYTRGEAIKILYNYASKMGMLNIYTTQTPSTNTGGSSSSSSNSNQKPNQEETTTQNPTTQQKPSQSSPEIPENSTEDEEDNSNNQTFIPEIINPDEIDCSQNQLKELYISNGVLEFNPEQKQYTVIVPYDVTNTEIFASSYLESTDINGLGTKKLSVGVNNFLVTTANPDNTYSIYEISVIRKEKDNVTLDKNNYLQSLFIDSYNIDFNRTKQFYEIPYLKLSQLNISALTESSTSKVTISGNSDLKSGSLIKIIVTAENGRNRIYTLRIMDKNEKFFKAHLTEILILSIIVAISILVIWIAKDNKKTKKVKVD